MKTKRFRLLTVLLAAVMMFALSLNVMAAKSNAVTQDGLTAQLVTNKDSYKAGESVKASVQVDNHTGKKVYVITQMTAPDGVVLEHENVAFDTFLENGESWEAVGGVVTSAGNATTAGSSTATGDNMQAAFWVILTTLAVCGMIALFVYGKNKTTWLSIMLCIAMVGGMVTAAVPAQAAGVEGSISLSCTIQVEGKDQVVSATVSYMSYEVDVEDTDDTAEAATPSEPSQESSETVESSSDASEETSESSSDTSEESSESSSDVSEESSESSSDTSEESSEKPEESKFTTVPETGSVMIGTSHEGFSSTGTWKKSSLQLPIADSTLYTNKQGDSAVWYPYINQAEDVEVFYYKTATRDADDPALQIEVFASGEIKTIIVDFTQPPVEWYSLGKFDFSGDGSEYIKITKTTEDDMSSRATALKFAINDNTEDGSGNDSVYLGTKLHIVERMGILDGGDDGITEEYIEKIPTRIQAAIIALKLNGVDADAAAFTGTDTFADASSVEAELAPYLAYLKAHPEYGFVSTADNKFDPKAEINEQFYAEILLSALGYKEGEDFAEGEAVSFARAKGIAAATSGAFNVNDLAIMTESAFNLVCKDGTLLLEKIISERDGVAEEGIYGTELPTDLEAAREKAKNESGLIFNNDGNDVYTKYDTYPAPFDASGLDGTTINAENFLKKRSYGLEDTKVSIVSYGTGVFNSYTHNSTVSDTRQRDWSYRLAEFNDGKDTLATMIEFVHSIDRDIFWSMRMNDTHDFEYEENQLDPWKQKNLDLLMCSKAMSGIRMSYGASRWSAVDYTHNEVRQLVYDIIEDTVTRYDVDGIELDFTRHPLYFKEVTQGNEVYPENIERMNNLIRSIRDLTEATSIAKGKPILLAIIVPDSIGFCHDIGLDIETWMEEGLIDIVSIGSSHPGAFQTWENSIAEYKDYDVRVYANLDDNTYKENSSIHDVNINEAALAYAAGADGITLYNQNNVKAPVFNVLDSEDAVKEDTSYNENYQTKRKIANIGYVKGWKNYVKLTEQPEVVPEPTWTETGELIVTTIHAGYVTLEPKNVWKETENSESLGLLGPTGENGWRTNVKDAKVTYDASRLENGKYGVYIYVTPYNDNQTPNKVDVTVTASGVSKTIVTSGSPKGKGENGWIFLGTYDFNGTAGDSVVQQMNENAQPIVDDGTKLYLRTTAVKFVKDDANIAEPGSFMEPNLTPGLTPDPTTGEIIIYANKQDKYCILSSTDNKWTESSLTGPDGSTKSFNVKKDYAKTATVTYDASSIEEGEYGVYIYMLQNGGGTPDKLDITIKASGEAETLVISGFPDEHSGDYKAASRWLYLGKYTFNGTEGDSVVQQMNESAQPVGGSSVDFCMRTSAVKFIKNDTNTAEPEIITPTPEPEPTPVEIIYTTAVDKNYYTMKGTWTESTNENVLGPNGASSLWTREKDATITWDASELEAGNYGVYIYVTPFGSTKDKVDVTITTSGKSVTLVTSGYPYESRDKRWLYLGKYDFDGSAGDSIVQQINADAIDVIKESADGGVIRVSAVKFIKDDTNTAEPETITPTPEPEPTPVEIIYTTAADTDYYTTTGKWKTSTNQNVLGPNGGSSLYTREQTAMITWDASKLEVGTYGVYIYVTPFGVTKDKVDVTITASGETETLVTAGFPSGTKRWLYLGKYDFNGSAGDSIVQQINVNAIDVNGESADGGVMRVSAVKFIKNDTNIAQPEIIE